MPDKKGQKMPDNLRRNIIDISVHAVSGLIFSAAIYIMSGRPSYAAAFFAGAVLIDLDHLIDHFLYFRNRFRLSEFLSAAHINSGKIYLFLHAWELAIALLLAGEVFGKPFLMIFAAGLSLHLIIDNVQRKNPFAYLISYRIMKKFNANIILPEITGPR
jgi:hypothetical protein